MKKEEKTVYENEKTQYEATQLNQQEQKVENEKKEQVQEGKKGSVWAKGAAGLGLGILLGTTTSFVAAGHKVTPPTPGPTPGPTPDPTPDPTPEQTPDWSDGKVEVATGVNDEMSFSEAFAAARQEVGAGGAFEWRGNIYGTYYAEEWENMSQEERDEYHSHFNWAAQETEDVTNTEEVAQEDVVVVETTEDEVVAETDVEIETTVDGPIAGVDDVDVIESDNDVEILGVVHDAEEGVDVGVMEVDGQDVFLIDVDTDGTFDVLTADINQDGQITEDEIVDIQGENISVNQFEMASDSYYAMNDDTVDYTNDADDVYEA